MAITNAKQVSRYGCELPVIRIMPNTPTAIGQGVIPYCTNDLVSADQLSAWLADMAPCGLTDLLDEKLIDAASALSGCGPAYVYMFIEALADGAVACGVPRAKALTYAANTLLGATQMVLQTGEHPGALKDAVCSPGGTTIEAVEELERKGFRAAIMDAMDACAQKSREMSRKND